MATDFTQLRYVEDDEWRVLTAVELGHRNHELVGTELIGMIARVRGSIHHHLQNLSRSRLVQHEGKPYDGYYLTRDGYDYLAMHALVKRGIIDHVGCIIGQGKEADVYTAFLEDNTPVVVKLHRVGRVSFRRAKDSRDYLSRKRTGSWLYLSRLSAQREFAMLERLQEFPVPRAISWNRHAVVMSLVDGVLLNNVTELGDPELVFERTVDLAVQLLSRGVVHADFTQFNVLINEDQEPSLIDFPQCLPWNHPMARPSWEHDIAELKRWFEAKFRLDLGDVPAFSDVEVDLDNVIDLRNARPRHEHPVSHSADHEEEEEEAEDERVASRVARENRLRRKAKARREVKSLSRLQAEAKACADAF